MTSFDLTSTAFQRWLMALAAFGAVATTAPALSADAPAQKPLLSSTTGAKPNLMIALDNSGSMAFPYNESYGVTSDDEYENKICPDPYSNSSSSDRSTFNAGKGGDAIVSGSGPNTVYTCYERSGRTTYVAPADAAVSSSTPIQTNQWSAQRSSEVNPLYYNPRITYLPRVDASGVALKPNDGFVFVSNQNSARFSARAYRKDSDRSLVQLVSTFFDTNPDTTGWTQSTWTGETYRTPRHAPYTTTDSNTPGFTYGICSKVVTSGGRQTDCGAVTRVTIKPGSTASVTLPTDHKRTDTGCTATACTNAAEIANIMNWFRYYGFRAPAVVTAIGQALANKDYYNQLRLGYLNINQRSNTTISALSDTPGVDTSTPDFMRGVRLHSQGGADTNRLYTWLYDQDGTLNTTSNSGTDSTFRTQAQRRFIPAGGTPLHNAVNKVASYYSVNSGAKENPWATNPAALSGGSNAELTCRRSFNLLFSDGAWNSGTKTTFVDKDYDNIVGTNTFSRTLASGATETFKYNPNGDSTNLKKYTPFPGLGINGLSDLAARYAWHTDFRPSLANGIQTDSGQPAFWQNMTTYTVGYLVKPKGDITGNTSGLSFKQIDDYILDYAKVGATATKPTWATGDVNTGGTSADEQARIDDFIQAGFTGGGRGFSAQSSEDVRDIFDTVLSAILNSSGRDAGVSVSTTTGSQATIAGQLRYGVSYKTLDNSGDIDAQTLDAEGKSVIDTATGLAKIKWSAASLLPAYDKRNIFTLSPEKKGIAFTGRFDGLPSDIQAVLKYGTSATRVANDTSFVNYLRGLDPVADPAGQLFRQRPNNTLGAMVNPPSIYMGGGTDSAYDLGESTVQGATTYLDFVKKKQTYPASLMVATNAGVVHNLDAESGNELAAFMPRLSLKRMLNYANAAYQFEYVLDGPLSENDIYDPTAKTWNHLAVGTGGRGEKLIYALRSPLNGTATATNRVPTKDDFLWEVGPTSGPLTVGSTTETNVINDTDKFALGHITQPVRGGQMQDPSLTSDGQWVVIANSGHYNGDDNGKLHGLLVLDAMTGDVIKRIPLPAAYDAGRGLSGVTLVRTDEKRILAAYAGDAKGNLWRFDLRGSSTGWAVSHNKPLFTTPNNRPIYGAPAWQGHPKGGTIVVVATGMLLEEADISDTATKESIYGIWDQTEVGKDDHSPFTTALDSQLLTQSIDKAVSVSTGLKYSTTTKNVIDWTKHRGWKFQLGTTKTGERNIDQVRNVGSSVFINTVVVAAASSIDVESCTAEALPANFIYGLRAIDGASQYSFDTNKDGKLDNASMVEVTDGGFTRGIEYVNLSDPTTSTPASRLENSVDEGAGESTVTPQTCIKRNVKIVGTNSAISAGTYCPQSGWSRTQYQLSAPPK